MAGAVGAGRKMIAAFGRVFEKHALVANSGTCVLLYAGGDMIEQKIEGHKWDHVRTARMAGLGLLLGPCNHFWYTWLDKVVPAVKTVKTVGSKILMDQVLFSPFSLTTFFIAMGCMEGKSRVDIVDEMNRLWLPTYKMDWSVWPGAQLLNFYFVPSKFRVLYVSSCTLAWNVYLSKVKHSSEAPEEAHASASSDDYVSKLEKITQQQPVGVAMAALPVNTSSNHNGATHAKHITTQAKISKADIALGLPLNNERV